MQRKGFMILYQLKKNISGPCSEGLWKRKRDKIFFVALIKEWGQRELRKALGYYAVLFVMKTQYFKG